MSGYTQADNRYIAFEIKSNMFAVPIGNVKGIVSTKQNIPHVIPPHSPKHVKFIAQLGGELLTVVELLEIADDIFMTENLIIILVLMEKAIGVLAHGVHLTTVAQEEISEDKVTGARTFTHDGTPYIMLDVSKLYKCIGA